MQEKLRSRLGSVVESVAEPETDPETERWLKSFSVLSRSRSYGFGINPITLTEMAVSFDRLAWFCDDFELFVNLMQMLDGMFLEHHAPKETGKK